MTRLGLLLTLATVFLGSFPSANAGLDPAAVAAGDIAPPSAELTEQFKLAPFYKKHLSVGGFPVLASEQVSDYDPELAKLVEEAFGDGGWRYTHPGDRKGDGTAHLKGFDLAKAPTFAWPKKLQEWYDYHQKLEAAGGR